MQPLLLTPRSKTYSRRLSFRYYSRQILQQPTNMDMHTSRIMAAMELPEKEPLQGAMADMFYGCWFDVPFFGERMLNLVKEKLSAQAMLDFKACIAKTAYIKNSNHLATRWSVLITPSFAVHDYQMRTSTDDARVLAEETAINLMNAADDGETDKVEQLENEFFAHCIACHDKLAFSLLWWQLAKHEWIFDERWEACQQQLEKTDTAFSKKELVNKEIVA